LVYQELKVYMVKAPRLSVIRYMPGERNMLTTGEVADLLSVDRHTVTRWIRLGQLRAVRLPSGQFRVRREDVDRLLAADHQHEDEP
jgi:excisionase family DNA binding protein